MNNLFKLIKNLPYFGNLLYLNYKMFKCEFRVGLRHN